MLGWTLLISLVVGSLIIYFIALGVYKYIKAKFMSQNDAKSIEANYELLYKKFKKNEIKNSI